MLPPFLPPIQLRFKSWWALWRPVDALLPLSIALHTYKSSRELGVALLVIWMAWRLTLSLIEAASDGQRSASLQLYLALLLGLLLVNARVITLRDDVQGPSQFLLIALGFVIGCQLLPRAWRITFGWLAVSLLPLLGLFVVEALATGAPLTLGQVETIYNNTMRGHGGISRFATLVLMLTMCAWYFTIFARGLLARGLGLVTVISGYALCLGSASRIAIYGAPLAALLAWSLLRLQGRRNTMLFRLLLVAGTAFVTLLLWWFVFSPDAAQNRLSDFFRMEAARCWLSIMFSGHNRFIWGIGYGSEIPNRICYHIPDFRGQYGTIGHAHNTFAHIAGQHGLLGLIALLILILLVVRGLRGQFTSVQPHLPLPLSLSGTSWAEAALGVNLALALNFLATTIHISNQINQVLIGLLAATAINSFSPGSDFDSSDTAKDVGVQDTVSPDRSFRAKQTDTSI